MATRSTIDIGYVGPNQSSKIQVSNGMYSLSSRSNVPYASLIGASGFYKVFSWGEIVEIPCGQVCTVKNESFHGGDIVLNVGEDQCNSPARITVPVRFKVEFIEHADGSGLGEDYLVAEFPADVRRARQAFLHYDGLTLLGPYGSNGFPSYILLGQRSDGSHRTFDHIQPLGYGLPGVGYVEEMERNPGEWTIFPLGFLSVPGDRAPHCLLTAAQIYLRADTPGIYGSLVRSNAYYSMEY